MVDLKSDPSATVASETPLTPQYAMRLATDAEGNHGYEIGYFPANSDFNDPGMFVVVNKAYGQVEAAAIVNSLNMAGPPPQDKAEEHATDEDEDHEAAARRRAQHGPLRHKSR